MHISLSLSALFIFVRLSATSDPTISKIFLPLFFKNLYVILGFFDGLDHLNKCKIRLERRLIGLYKLLLLLGKLDDFI